MKPLIEVDIVSDVVCPWCYIGEARLHKAMDRLKDAYDFKVVYHPFQLNPHIPDAGVDSETYFAEKFGGRDRMQQIFARTANSAHDEGLPFDLGLQKTAPNTFKAHRLVAFAQTRGKQLTLVNALFKAYFAEGKNMGDDKVLVALATQVGLAENEVREVLGNEAFAEEVSNEQMKWHRLGISSVPSFIIQNKYLVQGAQPPEAFLEVFGEVAPVAAHKGESCTDESCEI